MKQFLVMFLATATIIFVGCKDIIQNQKNSDLRQFSEEPVTIAWNGDTKDDIQNFQANVQVYSMNNRHDSHASLSHTYRLAVKRMDDSIVTRIDFDFDESIPYRSFISDGTEAIAFNPNTQEIGYRMALEESKPPLYRILEQQCGLSKVNLSLLREEAKRLSLHITEEADKNILMLEIPPALIPQNGLNMVTSSHAVFNLANETLLETEMVMVREDGTIVTVTTTPVYEDTDGVPVKIGMVTVIDSKAPGLIEEIDPDTPIFESLDDIPTLSESQFAELNEAGNLHEISEITFGDPADLSYTETVYEIYRDIEINTAPDSLFRLIQE